MDKVNREMSFVEMELKLRVDMSCILYTSLSELTWLIEWGFTITIIVTKLKLKIV